MNSAAAVRWLLYTFLIALQFGTRKFLFQFTPGFHEYEAAFLYTTDIIGLCFIISAVLLRLTTPRHSEAPAPSDGAPAEESPRFFPRYCGVRMTLTQFQNGVRFFLVAFLLIAFISVFFAPSLGLALYSFTRLFTAAAFAASVAYVVRHGLVQLRRVFGILAASAVFQSLIAFAQFVKQGSVGLWVLGEPALSATAPGIAKFTAEGGKMLRAYGTFPHPNVFGAFLVVGLLILCYLFLRKYEKTRKYETVIIEIGIFTVLLGLILTFSRSAWLIGTIAIAAVIFSFAVQMQKSNIKNQNDNAKIKFFLLLFTLLISSATLFFIFKPFILSRAPISATEPSVVQRLGYNRLGITLIAQHPFGVGLGNQVMHSVRNGLYEKFGMTEPWQWEPIHNIYLLIGSEIGILGLIAFVVLLLTLFCHSEAPAEESRRFLSAGRQGSSFRMTCTTERIAAASMLVALLLFGLVDHFLWTLRPGQLLLWLAIGILWGVSPSGDEEREDVHV